MPLFTSPSPSDLGCAATEAANMNWTGGNLQRTKHANQGVVQRQKAYFARARTQLQNGTKAPTAPFRPTFLQKDNSCLELAGRPPRVGTGSVRRHARHSARRRDEPATSRPPPSPLAPRYTEEDPSRAELDAEGQLLEANRKRLLRQRDWIGIAHSQPVHFHFMSDREKSKMKMGRRSKLRGTQCVDAARHRDDMKAETYRIKPATGPKTGGGLDTIGKNGDEIHIRIGRDALTTASSTRGSHTCSDAMLFDQPAGNQELAEINESMQPDIQDLYATDDSARLCMRRQSPDSALLNQYLEITQPFGQGSQSLRLAFPSSSARDSHGYSGQGETNYYGLETAGHAGGSQQSMVHQGPPSMRGEAEGARWSQHGGRGSHAVTMNVDEDEKTWQDFVLGMSSMLSDTAMSGGGLDHAGHGGVSWLDGAPVACGETGGRNDECSDSEVEGLHLVDAHACW
ncbi:hypothetical protein ACEQ8H_002427 [Pleosporales sp. CAS-2024a]